MTSSPSPAAHPGRPGPTVCGYCGEPLTTSRRPGPAPRYCSPAHRQRAYEQRRDAAAQDDAVVMTAELEQARARIRILEHDNRRLRDELDQAIIAAQDLRHRYEPSSPIIEFLVNPPPATRPGRPRRT